MRVIGMCQVSEWCGDNAMHIHSIFFFFSCVKLTVFHHENSKLYFYSRSCCSLCLCSCAWCVRGHRRQAFTHLHERHIYALTCSCETRDTMAFFNPKNEKCKLFFIISFVIPIYIFVFFFRCSAGFASTRKCVSCVRCLFSFACHVAHIFNLCILWNLNINLF